MMTDGNPDDLAAQSTYYTTDASFHNDGAPTGSEAGKQNPTNRENKMPLYRKDTVASIISSLSAEDGMSDFSYEEFKEMIERHRYESAQWRAEFELRKANITKRINALNEARRRRLKADMRRGNTLISIHSVTTLGWSRAPTLTFDKIADSEVDNFKTSV